MEVNKQLVDSEESESLGITCQKPKFPQYAVVSKRQDSYKTWPDYLPLKPEPLVDAGLVYTGVGDSVRCYFCGGGLKNWERGDSPWFEHAKWYPSCPHVLLVKGQEFVDKVAKGQNPDVEGAKAPKAKSLSDGDLLDSAAALSCVQTGFSEGSVKKAIAEFIQTHGNAGFKGEDLCHIILRQEEENEKNARRRTGTSPSTSTRTITVGNVADGGDAATGSTRDIGTIVEEAEDDLDELQEENRRLKENKLCRICLDDQANIIFLPCGHMVTCPQCAPALVKCPMCRRPVNGFVKAYFASS